MARDRRTGSSGRTWWGIGLLILGGALLLDSAGAIDLGDLIEVLWPLLLIAWGVKIVRDGRSTRDRSTTPETTDHIDVARVFGDVWMRAGSLAFTGGSVSTTFGDLELAGQRREGLSPSIHHESAGYESAPRRLRIVASQVFGDVIVR